MMQQPLKQASLAFNELFDKAHDVYANLSRSELLTQLIKVVNTLRSRDVSNRAQKKIVAQLGQQLSNTYEIVNAFLAEA